MFGSSQWMYSSGGGFYDTEIDGSLRFNDNDSAYLSRTLSSNTNRRISTFSAWVKWTLQGSSSFPVIFGAAANGSTYRDGLYFNNNKLTVILNGGVSSTLTTTQLFRDPSAWYHIVMAIDTTQATSSNRIKLYVNGEQVTAFSTSSYPSQNYNPNINSAIAHNIARSTNANDYFDGYMADIYLVDGSALSPTSFGETKSGVWIPKAYSGSYGTNGFHLEFAGNANDSSGNGNNWTANNISSYDYVPDSPTNNFAVLNPLHKNSVIIDQYSLLSEGNLVSKRTSVSNGEAAGTFGVSSGKWYFEIVFVQSDDITDGVGFHIGGAEAIYRDSGNFRYDGSQSSYGSSWSDGDIIGVALDLDNTTIAFYKNNVSQGNAKTDLPDGTYLPFIYNRGANSTIVANFGQDSSFAGNKTAQGNSDDNGQGDFYYTPPTGYLALCTANLTVAEGVDPAEDNSPQDHFNTVLYSGNSSTNAITGVGFQPDFVWMKGRTNSSNPTIVDAVRGISKSLATSSTNGDITHNSGKDFLSFDSDGFTLGTPQQLAVNNSGQNYVAWNWKESASAGVDIVLYSGTGSARTIAHSLGAVPKMMICKERNGTSAWRIYNANFATPATQRLQFDNGAVATTNTSWNATNPTSSVFSVGADTNTNESGKNYVMYLFADVDGFSKFGSYEGNLSNDGPFVYTGFRPALVVVKDVDDAKDWRVHDDKRGPYNAIQTLLEWNTADAEGTGTDRIDFVSNGFKIRNNSNAWNNTHTYIYIAFAENPFKYANAR